MQIMMDNPDYANYDPRIIQIMQIKRDNPDYAN